MTRNKKEEKETVDILNREQKIARFVDSEDWKEVKKVLYNKMITFDSITGIPKEKISFEELGRETAMREAVVQMVLGWVRDVEGTAANAEENRKLMQDVREQSVVEYFN